MLAFLREFDQQYVWARKAPPKLYQRANDSRRSR
jgi:hypothetical protein